MDKKRVLDLMELKKLPKKFNGVPAEKCIAKVSRSFGEDDYAIYKDGECVCDKGYRFAIKSVLEYYYEEPKKVGADKLAEIQRLAETARKQELIDAVWEEAYDESAQFDADKGELTSEAEISEVVERPTVYKDMMAFIKEHKLTESKGNLPKEEAVALLDKYFA
jgi:hypothetical protein